MAKTKISEFSTTPGNNTDINGINIAEGCAPSGINNAIRELMSDLKEWQSGAMDVYVIPQGTAAAPGIQLYGDLDTGLYGFAANQLGVAVGGASAGYFSSAGWVGNVVATTVDLTNIEVTNIKAKDGTTSISLADSTGIATFSKATVIETTDNTNAALRITQLGTGNALLVEDATNPDTTPTVIDQFGNVILGTTARTTPVTSKIEIHGTASELSGLSPSLGFYHWSATASLSSTLTFRHYPSGTVGTLAANTLGDVLGRVVFLSYDGTNAFGAVIRGVSGAGGTAPSITYDASGGHNFTSGPIDVENLEVTNIKARDGTAAASIADSTGAITVTKDLTANGVTLGKGLGSVLTNTALGRSALAANTVGDLNTAVGNLSLTSNTGGTGNTAVGHVAMTSHQGGSLNTAVGAGSLTANLNGNNNTAIGQSALGTATGSNNTAVGSAAGSLITNGNKNTIIGNYDGNQGGLDIRTASNYIVLSDGDGNPRAYWNGADATFGGALTATTITGTQVNSDNLRLDGNTLSSTDTNGNITIAPNGTGQVVMSGDLDVANIETGAIKARDGTAGATIANSTGQFTFSANIKRGVLELGQPTGITIAMIKATNTNGSIILQTNGTGSIFNYADETVLVPSGATAKLITENGTNFEIEGYQETGTFTVGGTAQTGTQTIGRSTKTHTLNLGTGATESGLTKTINLGTGGVATSTTAINIGSANGTTISLAANPTLSAGTANGVVYLNGSKVATSGSALTFDGTTLANSTSGTPFSLNRTGAATALIELKQSGTIGSYIGTSGSNDLIIYNGSATERARFNNASFNIGGNFTSTNNTLQVTGRAAIGYTAQAPTDGLIVAGNVGVGTDAPAAKLEVAGGTSSISGLFKSSSGTATNLTLQQTGVRQYSLQLPASSNDFAIRDDSANAERLRLDSSGNLGLGVAPSGSWGSPALMLGKPGAGNPTYPFLTSTNTQQIVIGSNSYWDGTDWKAAFAGSPVVAMQQRINYNQISWHTASAVGQNTTQSFTQAMTLDESGRLLVGPTSAASVGNANFAVTGGVVYDGNFSLIAQLTNDTTAAGKGVLLGFNNSTNTGIIASAYGNGSESLAFWTHNNTSWGERARITSGGDLYVGTQTDLAGNTAKLQSDQQTASRGAIVAKNITSTSDNIVSWNAATSGDNIFVGFYTETAITSRGSITYNRAGGLVAYNTTSDYRAKDIIGPVQNPGATIDALKVYEGVMKGATQSRPMLIAHEAQEHAPYAVSGEKDAVNEDGTPKFQQMDVASLVPLLLAEIQSLRVRVAQLEGK